MSKRPSGMRLSLYSARRAVRRVAAAPHHSFGRSVALQGADHPD
ncbi:hypothetical protein [Lysobacter gummosus]